MAVEKIKLELLNQIFQECIQDEKFKEELVKNPQGAVEKKFGQKIDPNIRFIESTEKSTYFVLPPPESEEIKELEKKAASSDSPQKELILLVVNSVKNNQLKQQLITDPKGILARECGIELPEEMNVKVIENSESSMHYIIPSGNIGELSDKELKQVAGGNPLGNFFGLGDLALHVGLEIYEKASGKKVSGIFKRR